MIPFDVKGIVVRQELLDTLSRMDSLIMDIDGVLVDVSESFPLAVQEAVRLFIQTELGWAIDAPPVTTGELDEFKRAGGFNNDWDLAQAVVLFLLTKSLRHGVKGISRLRKLSPSLEEFLSQVSAQGGGLAGAEKVSLSLLELRQRRDLARLWKRRLIVQMAQELYAGPRLCSHLYGFEPRWVRKNDGYIQRERVLVDIVLVKEKWRVGIITGRTRKETALVLTRIQLADRIPESFWITDDDHPRKPDPFALQILAQRMRAQVAVYVGDTVDDLHMVKAYQEKALPTDPAVLSAQVLTGHGGARNRSLFLERGADILCASVNDLLIWLDRLTGSAN